jgi:hypothetical protein
MTNNGGPWDTPDVMGLLSNYDMTKPEPEDAPYAALANRVLERAKTLRKDWTTYRVEVPRDDPPPETDIPGEPPPASRPAPPKADLAISIFPSTYDGFTVPLPPRSFMLADVFPPEARNYPALATIGAEMAERPHDRSVAKIALYDFRQCPDDIMDSLRWIKPPDAAPAKSDNR